MQRINPNIDQIVTKTADLMSLIDDEYKSLKVEPSADYMKGVAWIGFRIGVDYFFAARDALEKDRLLSGTNLVRSNFENLGDLYYIYCTPGKQAKYAKAYVDSMNEFTKVFVLAKLKGFDATAQERALKQANKWTNATIEDRLKATGKAMLTMYDMMSYFSHPNPGVLTYLDRPSLLSAQINLVKQCNCINAINIMGLVINHSDIKSVTHLELNAIATEIGFPLMQTPKEPTEIDSSS
jgi:hypothetical protein